MRKGQISIEYLIIIGVVVFLIVLPSAIFLSSFAQSTIYGAVTSEQAQQLGEGLTVSAKQVYYLGLYAQKKVSLPMPDNVQHLMLLRITRNGQDHHYVVVRIDDGSRAGASNYFFQSSAPLISDTNLEGVTYSATGPDFVSECATYSCSYFAFEPPITNTGQKQFLLETRNINQQIQVNILPVIE